MEINSAPSGAQIFEGSRALGRTPLTLKRRKSSRTITLRLKRRGYNEESVKVKLSESRTLTVKMKELFELLP